MGSVSVSLNIAVLFVSVVILTLTYFNGAIPTTLDGPFKPVTVPLDKSFRGHAIDLPDTDPRVQRTVQGWKPEQISVSLSTNHDSVWISWVTGLSLSLFTISSVFHLIFFASMHVSEDLFALKPVLYSLTFHR